MCTLSVTPDDKLPALKRWVVVSYHNPRSWLLLRSKASIEYEMQRHLKLQDACLIHPFSLFRYESKIFSFNVANFFILSYRMYWEVFMTVVFFFALFVIPLNMILNFHSCRPFETPLSVLTCVSDTICMVDLACSFLTGFVDTVNKQVVLEKDKVIR